MAPPPGKRESLSPTVAGQPRFFCCHRATLTGSFPPNSLAAVEECVAASVPRLEVDVRFLADDSMLVFHDARLDDETTGHGPVDALDAASARAIRYRSDETAGPATLVEVVDAIRQGETVLQVDLKLMRAISAPRLRALIAALAPIRDLTLIGSQAHWNLRPLAATGFRVAIDPTLQWHYRPGREGEGLTPSRLGVHGLWDDAPIAHIRHVDARSYCEARIDDIVGLLPGAVEWMVDIEAIRYLSSLGLVLGDALRRRGVALAAWTMKDEGREPSLRMLRDLFALGATTIITDDPLALGDYAKGL